MASRPKAQDFLHNFRFHVIVKGFGEGGNAQLGTDESGKVTAGFSSVTTPEASQDAVEYREGHFIYTQKFSGVPTISDISLMRGVALADGTFWNWMKDVLEGNAEYRADVSIYHLHRDAKPDASSLGDGQHNIKQDIPADGPGVIEYRLGQCFPIRHKVSSDLDATASEVSIQELDLAIEYFDVIDTGAA